MRIDLIAPPYSGHLHPLLAIARELAPHHQVRVLSTPAAQARIRACGLTGVSVLGDADDRVLRAIADPPHAVGNHPLRLRRQLRDALALMQRFGEALHARYRDERPELVIVDFTVPAAGLAAQALGIAWWTSLPSPCVLETPDGPPAYFGGLRPAGGAWARTGHALARRLTRGFKRSVHAWHRGQMRALGLPRLYRDDGSEAVYSPQCILALGLASLEFPATRPAALRFVGPRLCTPPSAVRAPPFVPGRRHVLVTLGTHLGWVKDRVDALLRALAPAFPQVEFHFSDGDPAAPVQAPLGNYRRLPYVDYATQLARYDLVVHHGGAGILYACLEAGRPAIVHPLDYDQFDHAARLQAAGAAWWLRDLDGLPALLRRVLDGEVRLPGLAVLQRELHLPRTRTQLAALVDVFATTGKLPPV